jgi:hypothetical protein
MIKEYGGKEMYASKKSKAKHETKESAKVERKEGMKFGKLASAAKRAKIKKY